ncbi:MAG: hydrogenase maturation protein, partial [Gammaproteobacteria bacterium]|nr:hydrogenase maturation protein [Gammaproteobacteria bacterium]
NPHYKDMGNLYGSEHWTYLLPRYVGENNVKQITQSRLPLGTTEALSLGLIDATFADNIADFKLELKLRLAALLTADIAALLKEKQQQRTLDEKLHPLSEYREKELEKMHLNFYGFDPSYHVARYNFIYKVPKSRTPLTIAKHRRVSDKLY